MCSSSIQLSSMKKVTFRYSKRLTRFKITLSEFPNKANRIIGAQQCFYLSHWTMSGASLGSRENSKEPKLPLVQCQLIRREASIVPLGGMTLREASLQLVGRRPCRKQALNRICLATTHATRSFRLLIAGQVWCSRFARLKSYNLTSCCSLRIICLSRTSVYNSTIHGIVFKFPCILLKCLYSFAESRGHDVYLFP